MPVLESSGALWLSLTIPAIVLLWVLRPRRPRLRVPSLLLWPGSPAERQSARPWQRLRNHPLLWIQIAVALLLALAAARPFLPAEAAGRQLMVLLDASGSMRARDVDPDRFTLARNRVLELARGLGPGQEMTVLRLDEQPRVLVAGARSATQVEAAMVGERPSYGPPDVAAALALATGLTQGPAEWVVIGDGGLAIPEGTRRPPDTGFRFLPIGRPAGNVAVTGLSIRQDGENRVLQAGLRNHGGEPVAGRLQLLAEGQMVGVQEWRLEPGAEGYVTWGHLPAGPSWYEARLSGMPQYADALEQDDAGWAAIAAPEEVRVLLVSPGNSFLERVLSVHGNVRPFRTSPADWPGVATQGAAYPLAVLDRLWPETWPSGSALVVGPPVGDSFRPSEVWPRSEHPLLRHVDWSEVQVGEARRVPLDPSWETVVDSDGGPLLAVRSEGGRRQAVLAFELSQSDLPLRPAFPVLMANLLEWLLPRPEMAPRTVAPGGALSPETSPLAQQLWVEAGDGTRYDLAPPWPPRPFRPPAPGLYRVVQSWEGESQQFLLVASGYHPQEAELAPRSFELTAVEGDSPSPARGALSFWPWLVAGVVLLSLVEWWVDARGS
ncbi:MAG: VWA domain-containing protein [Chloroflexota bacterium]